MENSGRNTLIMAYASMGVNGILSSQVGGGALSVDSGSGFEEQIDQYTAAKKPSFLKKLGFSMHQPAAHLRPVASALQF